MAPESTHLPSVYLPISSPSSPAGKRGRGPQERRVREDLALGFILQTFTECLLVRQALLPSKRLRPLPSA